MTRKNNTPMINTMDLLLATSFIVRKHGWMSKSKARYNDELATIDLVLDAGDAAKPTRTDKKNVQEALAWVSTLDGSSSDYEQKLFDLLYFGSNDLNLEAANLDRLADGEPLILSPEIPERAAGMAASAVGVHMQRAQRAKDNAKLAKKAGPFVGTKGQRITFEATLEELKYLDRFGCYLHVFVDGNGSRLSWMTGDQRAEVGDAVKVTGTVKDHRTYQGIKSTSINRCRVAVK